MPRVNPPTKDELERRLAGYERRLAALERRNNSYPNQIAIVRKATTAQGVGGTAETLTFDDTVVDTGGFVDGNDFVMPADGLYLLGATAEWTGAFQSDAEYRLFIVHAGDNLDADRTEALDVRTTTRVVAADQLDAGDRVHFEVSQGTGESQSILGADVGAVTRAFIVRIA